jgi:hypothetical protein
MSLRLVSSISYITELTHFCMMDDVLNVLVCSSYVAIAFSILHVFVSIHQLKRASAQIFTVFMLWFLFVFTCGVTHLTRVVGGAQAHSWSLLICTTFSVSAALLTILGVRTFNAFVASQVGFYPSHTDTKMPMSKSTCARL